MLRALSRAICRAEALVLAAGDTLAGGGVISRATGHILWLDIHPFWRGRGLAAQLLAGLRALLLPGSSCSLSTFRAGDPADPGYRRHLLEMGFTPGPLLMEFGYPTQLFILGGGPAGHG